MHETEVDGVPVFCTQAPGPLTARLVFGAGVRDETFQTRGVTHLVEHLAMSTLPRVPYEHDATVDLDTTEFSVTGQPAHVVEFLATVCAALADLPLEEIGQQARVLAGEHGHLPHVTAAHLLNRRFGPNGPGLARWQGPGYHRLTAEQVTEYARTYFTSANAVVAVAGPLPDGLRLPLRGGARPARATPPVVSGDGASWAAEDTPAPGLALLVPAERDVVANLAMAVLGDRLTGDVQREHGIGYDVDGAHVDHDTTWAEHLVWLTPQPGEEAHAASILWHTVRDLAADGPTAEELAFAVEKLRTVAGDPRVVYSDLETAARARLFGLPNRTIAAELSRSAKVTPEEIAATLTESLRTALLTVPAGLEMDLGLVRRGCPRVDSAPPGREFRVRTFLRLVSKPARGMRLVLGASGVTWVDEYGDAHHVEFADVVGVISDERGRTLISRQGCTVPVLRPLLGKIGPVLDAVDLAVPAELHFPPYQD